MVEFVWVLVLIASSADGTVLTSKAVEGASQADCVATGEHIVAHPPDGIDHVRYACVKAIFGLRT